MSKQVFKLFYKAALVFLPVILLFVLLNRKGFVALYTNSVSFDAKIENIKAQNNLQNLDLIAIGSSMTLNNISSKNLVDSLKCTYFNFSAWGLNMIDIDYLIKYYIPKYHPKNVLIVSSLVDFVEEGNETIKNYVNTPEILKHFNGYFYYANYNPLLTIAHRKSEFALYKNTTDNYWSLMYDNYGGVTLKIPRQNISAQRWNLATKFPTNKTDQNYEHLDSLAKYLNKQNIKLFYVQPPIKQAYIRLRTAATISRHFKKCESVINNNNGIYINLSGMPEFQTDKYFVDQFHLSDSGATVFTKQLVSIMSRAGIGPLK